MKKIGTKFFTSALLLSGFLVPINNVSYGQESSIQNITYENVELTEDDYKLLNNGELMMLTVDSKGNLIPYYRDRGWGIVIKKILVWAGEQLLGYVFGEVVDGVVVSVTGKSPSDWLTTQVKHIIGKPYTSNVQIQWGAFTCPGVVIDHSGRCNN